MRWPAVLCALMAVCAMMLIAAPAVAQDADTVKRAAAAFDDGSRAYRTKRYELAASHFEAADDAVPSARALRMAIRARDKADQPARAATLAAQALQRYPDDGKVKKLAFETISAHEDALHRLDVTCEQPCVLAVGTRAIKGKPRESWVVYVAPGEVKLNASFEGGDTDEQVVSASEGKSNKMRFTGPIAVVDPPTDPAAEPDPDRQPDPEPDDGADDGAGDDGPTWIEHPAVFIVLAVATAGVGGVTIWSGIDTINEPGTERVENECAGQGTDCALYQEGLDKQLRTNILIGATGGTALLTLIFAVAVTDWGGGGDVAQSPALQEAPLRWGPSLSPHHAGLSLGGRFR